MSIRATTSLFFALASGWALAACGGADEEGNESHTETEDGNDSMEDGGLTAMPSGGASGNDPDPDAAPPTGTAGMPEEPVAPPSGGSDGGPPVAVLDAGPPEPPSAVFLSNTPNAELVRDTDPDGLVQVVSSNLVQEPSGAEYFQQWYAEVRAIGTSIVCLISIRAEFEGSASLLASHYGFISASPYKSGSSSLSTDCIAPGETAAIYANGFAASAFDPGEVTTITFTWNGIIDDGAVPHPAAPTTEVTVMASQWIEGTLRNGPSAIRNLGLEFYVRSASGLIFDSLLDFHLDPLFANEVWSFQTLSADQPIATYLPTMSFIEGAN